MNLDPERISREARPRKLEHTGRIWALCTLAVLAGVLFLAIVLPNAGRVVADHTTVPPTMHLVGRLRQSVGLIVMAAVPIALVLVGTLRRSRLAPPGWILLLILLLTLLMKGV